jgi:hypothetical protein
MYRLCDDEFEKDSRNEILTGFYNHNNTSLGRLDGADSGFGSRPGYLHAVLILSEALQNLCQIYVKIKSKITPPIKEH